MQAAQPSTPHSNPKGTVTGHGSPMGSRKVPSATKPAASKAVSPIPDTKPDENGREEAGTPMPGQFDGEDDEDDKDYDKVKEVKGEPQKLDEAIDLGDEPHEHEEKPQEDEPHEIEPKGEAQEDEPHEIEPKEEPQDEEPLEQDHKSNIEGTSENWQPEETEKSEAALTEKPDENGTEIPDEVGTERPDEDQFEEHAPIPSEIGTEKPDKDGLEEQQPVPEDEANAEKVTEDGYFDAEPPSDLTGFDILEGCQVNKGGWVVDEKGNPIGKLVQGDAKFLAGKKVDAEGRIWNDSGKVIGKAEPIPEDEREPASSAPFEDFPGAVVDVSGKILFETRMVGRLVEGNVKELVGKKVDPDGDVLDKHGNVIGKAIREDEEEPEPEAEAEPEKIDCSALAGLRVNKVGNVVDDKGNLVGRVVEGALKALVNKTVDANGNIHNDVGKVIGRAEPIPENEKEERIEAPFEDFPGAVVEKSGDVVHEGKVIGKVIEGDAKKLAGKTVDAEGDIVDRYGTVLGKAERWEEEEAPEEPAIDMSILAGKRVNKAGNVVDSSGTIYGRLVEGDVKALAGKMCDKQGFVRNEAGDVIGKAELVPEGDREGVKTGPFADFPGCTVQKDGKVVCAQGIVGRLIEGDPKKLFGKEVDDDGDVLDKNGNVLGKAERWEEEEVKKDVNPMSGYKVNKAGDVYDENGELIGKLTEGELSRCAGLKIDDNGDVNDPKGNSIGHVSLIQDIPEKEDVNPMSGLKVNKNGEVYDQNGELIGKLTEGELSRCAGFKIDDDGDVVDQKGNSIGHVSLIQDIPEKQDVNPMSGLKVNKNGEVYDDNGDLIGKLTDGDALRCAGFKIDDEGDVVDQKGNTIGHVTLIQDIPEPEPEPEPVETETETEEEKTKRLQAEEDAKLATNMANCIQQSIERIQPVLKMITEAIDKAEAQPKEDLDEQKVVDEVKPLIEEGGRILQEANGVIRGLDPDGRIAATAKGKAASREATPEEYRLADLLKELTGNVTQTIDNAKKKIAGMPHAKKQLNPLWGLLSEPLFQILAAVGLLLSGVLGLVGQLLNGLGLGGLVNGILGGLGITRVLDGLGLGSLLAPITGSKKK